MRTTGFLSQTVFALFFLLLAGCSSVENAHRQKEPMMNHYMAGRNREALQQIEKELTPGISSALGTGDELMWRLESGALKFHCGDYPDAMREFKVSEKLIQEYDERASVSVRDVSAEGAAALTNQNMLPYRGWCRDRIMLAVYQSFLYLALKDEQAFRAQLRRLREEQKKVQDDYRKFFEKQEAELKEAETQNPKAAEKARTDRAKQLEPDLNSEFGKALQDTRHMAEKGYGNVLNPAAIFLSGLGSVRDENYENARIDFQRLYDLMPEHPDIRRWYVSVLRKTSRPVPPALAKVPPYPFPLDRDCVYVFSFTGRSAALRQVLVRFPVMAAWPVCEYYPDRLGNVRIFAGGKTYSPVPLANMDGVLSQEYQERLPGIIGRTILSTAIKDGAYYGGLAVIAASDMDPDAKLAALLSVAIVGAVYREAMNTADTRTWEILPKTIGMTCFPMPKDRIVRIAPDGSGSDLRKIRIPDDCRSAILLIGAPSIPNTAIHLFPMKSK